jgi:hypothetical protein
MELPHCPTISDGFGILRRKWWFGGIRQLHSIGFVSYDYVIFDELCTLELQSAWLERELDSGAWRSWGEADRKGETVEYSL